MEVWKDEVPQPSPPPEPQAVPRLWHGRVAQVAPGQSLQEGPICTTLTDLEIGGAQSYRSCVSTGSYTAELDSYLSSQHCDESSDEENRGQGSGQKPFRPRAQERKPLGRCVHTHCERMPAGGDPPLAPNTTCAALTSLEARGRRQLVPHVFRLVSVGGQQRRRFPLKSQAPTLDSSSVSEDSSHNCPSPALSRSAGFSSKLTAPSGKVGSKDGCFSLSQTTASARLSVPTCSSATAKARVLKKFDTGDSPDERNTKDRRGGGRRGQSSQQ